MISYLLLLSLSLLSFSSLAENEKITVVTENFPPYQIVEVGKPVTGIATHFVKALLSETDTSAEIKVYPWSRAYHIALTQPNVLIFSISRTPSREDKFHWLGSFTPLQANLWRLTSNEHIEVNALDDAKKYKIAIQRDDTTHHLLSGFGFKSPDNLYLTNTREQALKMLLSGRVDLVTGSQHLLNGRINKLNVSSDHLTKVFTFTKKESGLSVAFSKSTPLSTVNRFRKAYDKVKERAFYTDLFSLTPEAMVLKQTDELPLGQ